MANLTSVNINGALIRKEGTTTADIQGATMFPAAHQVFTSANISYPCAAVDPNNSGKIAVAYRDNDNSSYGKVRIGTIQSNNTIVWGTESTFNGTYYADHISIDFDYSTSPNRIVVVYTDGSHGGAGKPTAIVGTLSGTTVSSWGTKKLLEDVNSDASMHTSIEFDPNNAGKFAVGWNNKLAVCTISGSTITAGTAVANGSGSAGNSSCICWDPHDATKFLIAYEDNSAELHARVCQVSGTTITLQAVTTIDAGRGDQIGIAADPYVANRFVVSYLRDTTDGSVRTMRVTGSAGSWTIVGSPYYDFDGSAAVTYTNVFFTTAANRFIVTYEDNSNRGVAREGTLSATTTGSPAYYTVTGWDTLVEYNPASTHMSRGTRHTVHDTQTKKFVAIYDNDNTEGAARVGIAEHNKITVDLSTGNYFETDLEAATDVIDTFTITETLTGTQAQTFFLKITQGSTARQFDWSNLTHIKWPASTGPTITATNNAVDILKFTTYDQGTTWHGETIGQNFS